MSTNALELHVRRVAKALHDAQVCRLYKIPNDIKLVKGQVLYVEQGPADFFGYTAGGRIILLECKMFQRPSLPLGVKGLKPHQRRAMIEVHRAGGVALLVWQRDLEIAVVDSDQIAEWSKGRKSLPWKSISNRYKKSIYEDPIRFFWPFF